jgi:thioredoxin reductase (NADPH)
LPAKFYIAFSGGLTVSGTAKFDVIIIGAGPAGLTAAIYSAWLGHRTVVLEGGIAGGRAWMAPKIENFPGFPDGIKGSELVEKMSAQAARFKAEFRSGEEVVGLDVADAVKRAVTHKLTYEAPVLIVATGTQRRRLRVPGEEEFLGRGVSYCAVCDGPFFRNRAVAVVGNSEEAAADALALSDLAGKVTLVSQEKELGFEGALLGRLKGKLNVEIVLGKVTQIIGEGAVKALKLLDFGNHQEAEHAVNGVFVALGGAPLTAIMQKAGIATDAGGCLQVNRNQQTNIEGVFAAGDCTCGGMQIVTAAGEGAMAAMRASVYIRRTRA